MSQMNLKKILHNTIHSQFKYHTLPVTLFKTNPFIFVPALADCLYKEDVSLEHI